MKNYKNISKIKLFIIKSTLFLGQKTLIGRGLVRKKLINFINYLIQYGTYKESRFICDVNGIPFNFYNDKLTNIKLYFGRSENKEINFVKKNSSDNSVFIDIGSNMGLYTQNIAFLINNNRRIKIIAIDANHINNFRLKENLKLIKYKTPNIFSFVKIKNCAVGNRNTRLNLNFSKGLANGIISKKKLKNNLSVKCTRLIDIINQEKIKFITNLKIDIEGFEDRVLISFLNKCKKKLFPINIILEHSMKEYWNKDLIQFLLTKGYKQVFKNNSNMIFSLPTKS
jgi:FkbM family methyltransferase